jgi:hypothetical protein
LAAWLPISVASLDAPKAFVTTGGQITMFTETIEKPHSSQKGTKGYQLLSLFIALVFALAVHPSMGHAQIIGELEVNIPFPFHAGNTKLPPGKYVIHMLDNSDLTVMEIRSADALFDVRNTEANSTPAKSELVFNEYGTRYFLAKVFDEGNPEGSKVDESRYEKKVSKAAAEAQTRVPAHHRGQQGN